MAVVCGYATFATDPETAKAASVGTISLEALAEQDLAYMLRGGDYDGFIRELSQLSDESGEPELQAVRLHLPPNFSLTSEEFPRRVAAVLGTDQFEEALAAWDSPAPDYALTEFASSLLKSTVLAEYSDAAAMAAAGAVGAASAGGTATVVAALVAAGQVGGVAVLIASPIGIVVIGVGAAVLTFRLLTRKRRPRLA